MRAARSLVRRAGRLAASLLIPALLVAPPSVAVAPDVAIAAGPETYTFGLALPETGNDAPYGKDQTTWSGYAVEEINKTGGIGGKKLTMIVEDSQSDPKRGIAAFQKLTSIDKVPLVITAWSGVVVAIAPLAEKEKVVELSVGATSPKIRTAGKFTVSSYPLGDVDMPVLAKFARTELKLKRIAVIYINNDTGTPARVFVRAFKAEGGEIVADEPHEPGGVDYTVQVAKIRAANPDGILVYSLTNESPRILKQFCDAGLNKIPFLSYQAASNPEVIKLAGIECTNNLYYTVKSPPLTGAKVKEVEQRFRKDTGRDVNGLDGAAHLYDAVYFIKALIEYTQKNNLPYAGESLKKAYDSVKTFDLPLTGKIVLDKDNMAIAPITVYKTTNGKFEPFKTYEPTQ
jgi:branched-chain amino acid transport system substrate-binding protein